MSLIILKKKNKFFKQFNKDIKKTYCTLNSVIFLKLTFKY